MRVAVWHNNRDIRIEDVPRPAPGPGEMLVRVVACGICGSDVVEWYRLPRAPLVPGHELGGDVEEVGAGVRGFAPGDRVVVLPKVPCLECRVCRAGHEAVCPEVPVRLPGGFADFVLVPEPLVERGTYRLPDGMTHEQATFVEPLACAVRTQRMLGLEKGQSLLVMGSGMSGLLQVRLAVAQGLRVVATDVNPKRLELARASGTVAAIDARGDVPAEAEAALGGKADAVVLCTSARTAIEQAWACVGRGGAVVFFAVPGPGEAVPVPLNAFWTREIRILTAYYAGPADALRALRLIADGVVRVDDLVTHRLPLSEIARGYALVLSGTESLKVIVRPQDG